MFVFEDEQQLFPAWGKIIPMEGARPTSGLLCSNSIEFKVTLLFKTSHLVGFWWSINFGQVYAQYCHLHFLKKCFLHLNLNSPSYAIPHEHIQLCILLPVVHACVYLAQCIKK
jgi:hypothetical protein